MCSLKSLLIHITIGWVIFAAAHMGIEPAQAALVTQSHTAGGSLDLNVGYIGYLGPVGSMLGPDGLFLPVAGVTGPWMHGGIDRFQLLWSHRFAESGVPFFQSGAYSTQGRASVETVPAAPSAVILFGSGLLGIVGVAVRRTRQIKGQGDKLSAPILLLSPDALFAKEIETQLARSGYHMHAVASIGDAFPFAHQEMPAVILVDQRVSDWDRLRTDKSFSNVPMMILVPDGTVYGEEDSVLDLERGADGVHLCEEGYRLLVAKVGTYLRRTGSVDSKRGLYRVGSVELDSDLQQVKIGPNLVPLSAKPFAILEALMKAPSKVFSRGDLINLVWGPGFAIGDHVLDVHIHALRRLLQQNHDPLCRLVTIKSVGFKLTSLSAAMPASSALDALPMAVNSLPLLRPISVQNMTPQRTIAQPQSTSRRTWLEQVSRQRRVRLLRRKQSIRHLRSAVSIGKASIDPFLNSVATSSSCR